MKEEKFKEDPLFSVIVPVYDVPEDVFKRCLVSIDDQDYPNLEVIIVPNGGDEKAEEIAKTFAKGKLNWKVITTKEKGACQARNIGFKESIGEIVSFTNSDYILKPGCIRMWVDKLFENPDCGFVYGAYEYSKNDREVYWSKQFDVFELQNANYIDCGFPLWRKHVVEWDSEIKSLQDWDFWLSVVKSGVKGHFLGREISYIAEPPRPMGLSVDSSGNWQERVEAIRNKHGLPVNNICVTSLGASNHAKGIAKMLGADFRDDTLHKDNKYDALYLIGWYMKPNEEENRHSWIISRFLKSRKIVHFVGADIYWLREFSVRKLKEFAGALKLATDHILSENESAQKELREYGIESQIVPIPPYTDFTRVELFPKDFTVALYLTDRSDFDKYLKDHTLSLVKAMPDIKFMGYGDADLGDFKAKNFSMTGHMTTDEWAKFVLKNSAYVRLVRHDTRPMASDEFIMAGRSVITNVKSPFMEYIDTVGNHPFDSWDKYAPGFSPNRWPSTKSRIVNKIREVKKKQEKLDGEFMSERIVASLDYRTILDKDKYRKTINEMAKPSKVRLEVVNV